MVDSYLYLLRHLVEKATTRKRTREDSPLLIPKKKRVSYTKEETDLIQTYFSEEIKTRSTAHKLMIIFKGKTKQYVVPTGFVVATQDKAWMVMLRYIDEIWMP